MTQRFAPQKLEEATGISPDVLRDWRRRGFLDDVGLLGDNGRWTYSVGDVLRLAIALRLVGGGMSIKLALEIASSATPYVHAWICPERSLQAFRSLQYMAACVSSASVQIEYFHEHQNIGNFNFPFYHVLDIKAFSASMSAALKSFLREAL